MPVGAVAPGKEDTVLNQKVDNVFARGLGFTQPKG
jgi:hypothetical protein